MPLPQEWETAQIILTKGMNLECLQVTFTFCKMTLTQDIVHDSAFKPFQFICVPSCSCLDILLSEIDRNEISMCV